MSKEYWEEIQLEDLYNRFKEEGYTDEEAEKIITTNERKDNAIK
tara:strand:+ start:139 stop:270 length:132 start_codon:yes stop_codon:yes gene_type:complete